MGVLSGGRGSCAAALTFVSLALSGCVCGQAKIDSLELIGGGVTSDGQITRTFEVRGSFDHRGSDYCDEGEVDLGGHLGGERWSKAPTRSYSSESVRAQWTVTAAPPPAGMVETWNMVATFSFDEDDGSVYRCIADRMERTFTVAGPALVTEAFEGTPPTPTTTTPAPPPPANGPVARFTWSPEQPGDPHEPVTFDASSSTAGDAAITSYAWTFSETTGAADPPTASGMVVQTRLVYYGTYTVRLTVTDAAGRTSTASHQVSNGGSTPYARAAQAGDPVHPLAVVVRPASPRAGAVTALSVAQGPEAPSVLRYRWDLDDDGRADRTTREPALAHVFRRRGSAAVGLRIIRADGSEQATEAAVEVRRRLRIPRGARVAQRVEIDLTSRAASTPRTRRRLREVADGERVRVAPIADRGTFALWPSGRVRGNSDVLLAPLAEASSRSLTMIDVEAQRMDAVYLLSSRLVPGRMCLAVRGGLSRDLRVRTLGASGALRGIAISGPLDLRVYRGLRDAGLSGRLSVKKGRVRALPPACRALE